MELYERHERPGLLIGASGELPLEMDLLDAVTQFLANLEQVPLTPREAKGDPGVYYEPTGWIVLDSQVEVLRRLTQAVRYAEEARWRAREQELERRAKESRRLQVAAEKNAELYRGHLLRIRDKDYVEPHETPQTIAMAAVPMETR